MGKRKREEKREKELRRLKRKIEKLINRSPDESDTSSSPGIPLERQSPEPTALNPEMVVLDEQDCQAEEDPEQGLAIQHLQNVPTTQDAQPVPDTEDTQPISEDLEIDPDILEAMGSVEEEMSSGPPIHEDIAQRWTPILKKGLKKEERASLIKQYPSFQNIPTMTPPKLNAELEAATTDPVKKRDSIIENKQKTIAAALSAIGSGLQCFLTKGSKVEGIKNFHNAAKIMCDVFHNETINRRLLLQNVVNKEMKLSLQGEPDEFLFGTGLAERIRTTKAVQKSAQDLSKPSKSKQTKPYQQKPLNWRAPPQQTPKQTTYRRGGDKQSNRGGKRTAQEYRKGRPMQQQHSRRK